MDVEGAVENAEKFQASFSLPSSQIHKISALEESGLSPLVEAMRQLVQKDVQTAGLTQILQPQLNQIISLKIHGLGHSGEGVGHFNGYVVFVDGALPGEVVEAAYFIQRRQGRAHLLSISKPSPDRVTLPCKLFGRCGGCQLMHLSYPKQLEIKRAAESRRRPLPHRQNRR